MVDWDNRACLSLIFAALFKQGVLIRDTIFLFIRIHFRQSIRKYLFTLFHRPISGLIINVRPIGCLINLSDIFATISDPFLSEARLILQSNLIPNILKLHLKPSNLLHLLPTWVRFAYKLFPWTFGLILLCLCMIFHGWKIGAIGCTVELRVILLHSEGRDGSLGLDVYLALLFLCRLGSTLNIRAV